MGEKEKSAGLYYQAYYLYTALRDRANCEIMRLEMRERLGLEPLH